MVQNAVNPLLEKHLKLSDLRPVARTDLRELAEFLEGQDPKSLALPSTLSDSMLVMVARDLRSVELMNDDAQPSIPGPFLLVTKLLLNLGGEKTREAGLIMDEETLWNYLLIYQWSVEREIMSRITGLGGEHDEITLMARFSELSNLRPC